MPGSLSSASVTEASWKRVAWALLGVHLAWRTVRWAQGFPIWGDEAMVAVNFWDAGYRDLPFPFGGLEIPSFSLEARMSLQAYLDYISTWSAVRRCRQDRGEDPLEWLRPRLGEAWGARDTIRRLVWPMAVRAGLTRA